MASSVGTYGTYEGDEAAYIDRHADIIQDTPMDYVKKTIAGVTSILASMKWWIMIPAMMIFIALFLIAFFSLLNVINVMSQFNAVQMVQVSCMLGVAITFCVGLVMYNA